MDPKICFSTGSVMTHLSHEIFQKVSCYLIFPIQEDGQIVTLLQISNGEHQTAAPRTQVYYFLALGRVLSALLLCFLPIIIEIWPSLCHMGHNEQIIMELKCHKEKHPFDCVCLKPHILEASCHVLWLSWGFIFIMWHWRKRAQKETFFQWGNLIHSFPILHYLLEFAQTHVHRVDDDIQPSHPLSPLSSPALNLF